MRVPVYTSFNDQNLYQDDLNQEMQKNLSDNGWVAPSQNTTTITDLAPNQPDGTFWYDNTTNEVKWKINGTVRVMALV